MIIFALGCLMSAGQLAGWAKAVEMGAVSRATKYENAAAIAVPLSLYSKAFCW